MTVCILVLEQISKEVMLGMGHIPKKLRWSQRMVGDSLSNLLGESCILRSTNKFVQEESSCGLYSFMEQQKRGVSVL
jgi:hypothetical protein